MERTDLKKMYRDLESSVEEIRRDVMTAGIKAEITLGRKPPRIYVK